MGQLSLAETTYRRALGLRDNPASWVGMAAICRARGRLEEALGILLRITGEHPDDGHAWRGLSGVYADMGLTERAKACWQRADHLDGGPVPMAAQR